MALEKKDETLKTLKENFIFKSFKSLEYFFKNQLLCDLVLVSKDNVKFKVHKCVVSSASGYLKDIILSKTEKSAAADRIDLNFINGPILKLIISFMYEAELKTDKTEEIEEIVETSYFLQIDELFEICLLFLKKAIDNNNCLKLWRLAEKISAEKLEKACIVYILQNSSVVNDLGVDEIKKILTDCRHSLPEDRVFEYALKWAGDDTELFNEFIDCVRFSLLSKQFLLSDVLTNKSLMNERKVLEKIAECSRYKWKEDILLGFTSPLVGSRQKSFLAVVDSKVVQISSSGEIFDPHNDIKLLRRNFGYTTFHDNFLFICGGADGHTQKLTSCEYYSPNTGEFKSFPPLETGRTFHECYLIDDKIYACSGCELCQSVEIFDLGTEKWSKGPPMTSPRFGFGLTSVNRSLYAMGGCQSKTVEFLDPRSSDGWDTINDEFTFLEYTQCVSRDSKIYCFPKKNNVCIFDTRMNKCRKVDSGYDAFRENICGGFRVCDFNGELGAVLPNQNSVKLLKYNTEGEIIFKKELYRISPRFCYKRNTKGIYSFSCCLSSNYYYNKI